MEIGTKREAVVLCDLIPIMWVMLFVHMSILANKQKSYPLPPPFTFHALKVLFYVTVRKEEKRVSEICCPTQRNAAFILVCTIFD